MRNFTEILSKSYIRTRMGDYQHKLYDRFAASSVCDFRQDFLCTTFLSVRKSSRDNIAMLITLKPCKLIKCSMLCAYRMTKRVLNSPWNCKRFAQKAAKNLTRVLFCSTGHPVLRVKIDSTAVCFFYVHAEGLYSPCTAPNLCSKYLLHIRDCYNPFCIL